MFEGLDSLLQMKLDDNRITDIEEGAFAPVSDTLISLDMRRNLLVHGSLSTAIPALREAGIFLLADSEAHPYLEMVSGDGQSAFATSPLDHPFVVRAIGPDGQPAEGVLIAFHVVQGIGNLAPRYVRTDAEGLAVTLLQPGYSEGANLVEASFLGSVNRVRFATSVVPRVNLPPVAAVQPEDQTLILGDVPTRIDIDGYFTDVNKDQIFHLAHSGDTGVVEASVSGTVLSLAPAGLGSATVFLVGQDREGTEAMSEFEVTVVEPQPTDYDTDDDGLIEIHNLRQLSAIRWDLDGTGEPEYWFNLPFYQDAFLGAIENMGCPDGECLGYELAADLSFDTNGNGIADSGDDYWNDQSGWVPIGIPTVRTSSYAADYSGIFDGNGHTISHLMVGRRYETGNGLFAGLADSALVGNVVLASASVTGGHWTGTIAGYSYGTLINVHSEDGTVVGDGMVGGLVGFNGGSVLASASSGQVNARTMAGGIAGWNADNIAACASFNARVTAYEGIVGGLAGRSFGVVANSLSAGYIDGAAAGGLVGEDYGFTFGSWFDATAAPIRLGGSPQGLPTEALQAPTGPTGIYTGWDFVDFDVDGAADDLWDYGTEIDYPVLRKSPRILSHSIAATVQRHQLLIGLVSHWPMEEIQGAVTPDVVGGYHMDVVNLTEESLVPGHDGAGTAMSFDRADQTLLVRTSAPEDLLPINKHAAFTISMWVKVAGEGQNDLRLFSESSTGNNNPLFNIGTHNQGSTGQLDLYIRNGPAGWPTVGHIYSEQEPLDGTWRHIAFTQHANGSRFVYVDGALDPLGIGPRPPTGAWDIDTTSIGGIQRANPSHWVSGDIDEVALWMRALSAKEIKAVVRNGVPALQPLP